jgi:hypothetical protein
LVFCKKKSPLQLQKNSVAVIYQQHFFLCLSLFREESSP